MRYSCIVYARAAMCVAEFVTCTSLMALAPARAMLLLLAGSVNAWISTTQARFGSTIAHIYNESLGYEEFKDPQQSLGYLWTQPIGTADSRGLGGSITWAWDRRLCDELPDLFNENFWYISLVNCDSLKASMHRAFSSWAMNSRHIKFTDVTEQCYAEGYSDANCPHAEVWVASLAMNNITADGVYATPDPETSTSTNATNTTTASSDVAPAGEVTAKELDPMLAVQSPVFSEYFRYTNGKYPLDARGGKRVPETVRGSISIRTENICWYLDSEFCGFFHDLKHRWNSARGVRAVGIAFLFTLWFLICFITLVFTALAWRRASRSLNVKLARDLELDVQSDVSSTSVSGLERRLLVFTTEFTLVGVALRLLLLMIPWPFFNAIFTNCWSCYDFEAAAIHEIGGLLGFGQPDMAPRETFRGYEPTGVNSYHKILVQDVAFNNITCQYPWKHVRAGVPEGALIDPLTGVRPSVMSSFTLHNPRLCLTDDDLEGLNVLYPDCGGAPTTPVCNKAALNLGWLRMLIFIGGPLLVALLAAFIARATSLCKLRRAGWKVRPAHGTKDSYRTFRRASMIE